MTLNFVQKLCLPLVCKTCGKSDKFYVLASHPFGDKSPGMYVRCNGCETYQYTHEMPFRADVQTLVDQLKELETGKCSHD